ncbi:DUF881 domain-containing protein [Nocardioides anomalus]|uniref:DUF881 domain-containing protein n=1 Tax=Nocardioides anomalus TaxID=2712223 RepID=A0A6G6WD67_9ACTN|nr:DUF881 domain-containing protein [Nocardioides anomalus]QIG43291.1 DUF881 domain-containing protein [Nocardioides anomalus]
MSTRTQGTRESDQLLPDRVTMPLLALVTREAVDQDYVAAAQRRAAGPAGPQPRSRLLGAAAVTAVFGLLVALAAVRTAENADVDEASRAALVDRIDQRKADVRDARERVQGLEDDVDALAARDAALRRDLAAATQELGRLQVTTGFVDVRGPGLRVTVTDNPDGSADGRVRATDLRRLVNGLWSAGAEAVAVNGRRLTGLTAISQQGIAITVNRGPLTPPYVVSAIGRSGLGARLQATGTGQQFDQLAQQFGFTVARDDEAELELPSAPDSFLRLRFAEQPDQSPNVQEDLP